MEDYKSKKVPRYIQLDIADVCNQNCLHCQTQGKTNLQKSLTDEDFFRIFKDIFQKFPYAKYRVSGGEPFLKEELLFNILGYLGSHGKDLHINTNASLVTSEDLDFMQKMGFPYMVISLYGFRETHNNFTGNKEGFSRTINTIKECIRKIIPFEVNICLHKLNLKELRKITGYLINLGVKKIVFLLLTNNGAATRNWVNISYDIETGKRISAIIENLKERFPQIKIFSRIRVITDKPSNPENSRCIALEGKVIEICRDGSLYPCLIANTPGIKLGDFLKDDLSTIHRILIKGVDSKIVEHNCPLFIGSDNDQGFYQCPLSI